MLTNPILVNISQYMRVSNHRIVHLKLTFSSERPAGEATSSAWTEGQRWGWVGAGRGGQGPGGRSGTAPEGVGARPPRRRPVVKS